MALEETVLRMSFIKYIADENHYKEVLSLVGKAKQTVWIGTADIKDLYVDDKPFLGLWPT